MASPSPGSAATAAVPCAGDRRPVLVTGVPRSGTTWLARELADRPGVALPGREPMNPRDGQYALGGTLSGWTVLERPSPRQRRLLRRCYLGVEPRTLSRYGVHQVRAALPWTRVVVKDPFALLSVPAVTACTRAVPVVVFRHPGAVLASYRRMGWLADAEELRRCLHREPLGAAAGDDVTAMADFWTLLHRQVLGWLDTVPHAVLVSHADLVAGGPDAVDRLARRCGLPPRRRGRSGRLRDSRAAAPVPGRLHDFDRRADELARGWRAQLDPRDVDRIETLTAGTWDELHPRRARLA